MTDRDSAHTAAADTDRDDGRERPQGVRVVGPGRRSGALVDLLRQFADGALDIRALRAAAATDQSPFGAEVIRMLAAEQDRGLWRLRANARSMVTAAPTRSPR